jgi:hypothetical protein
MTHLVSGILPKGGSGPRAEVQTLVIAIGQLCGMVGRTAEL